MGEILIEATVRIRGLISRTHQKRVLFVIFIKNYVSRILDKLELKSRAELIIYLNGK